MIYKWSVLKNTHPSVGFMVIISSSLCFAKDALNIMFIYPALLVPKLALQLGPATLSGPLLCYILFYIVIVLSILLRGAALTQESFGLPGCSNEKLFIAA